VSRRDVQHALRQGLITVNGAPAPKGRQLRPGDRVDVRALLAAPPLPPPDVVVPVLYVDAALVAVSKPAGIPSVARRIAGRPSIASHLLDRMPDLAGVAPTPLDAGLVHRLDTGTSGVLLAARTPEAWRQLRGQFRRHTVEKVYVTVVRGRLAAACTLAHDLEHAPRAPGRMRIAAEGTSRRSWRAIARLTPFAWAQDATCVRVELLTGVTHQIRVQLAAIGHPIVGDDLYGGPAAADLPRRPLLHARRLRILHPVTEAPLRIAAPVPGEFRAALAALGFSRKRKGPADGVRRGLDRRDA
jgi:23S rRNA pseudouridine1911/1915/1917 synthase